MIPTMWPIPGVACNQRYGENKASWQPNGHTGMDFACPIGTVVHAAAAGTVLWADWAQGLGWPNPYYINPDFTPNDGVDQSAGIVVVIDHGPFVTVYAHLNQTGLNPGDKVVLGEQIGQVGTTGFSTGPHLHFEVMLDGWNVNDAMFGRSNPELVIGLAPALTATQRLVGPLGAKGRSSLSVADESNVVRLAPGGSTEEFDGWANGPVISGIGAWYHDRDNLWYWSGAFESQDTAGLKDLNSGSIGYQGDVKPAEPPLELNQRESVRQVFRRAAPDKNSQQLETWTEVPLRFTFKGYVRATDPFGDGNNIWFVGAFGTPTYFYSGAFKNPGVLGLPDLTDDLFPENPGPAVPPPVVDVPYDFTLDFLRVNGIDVEKLPAHLGNVDVGNFPENPEKAVCHWWNRLDLHPAVSGVITEFQKAGTFKSAHFVVTTGRVVQMVSLKDRAYHAGAGGNGWVGIEIDPVAVEKNADGTYTAQALKVQANVRDLLTQLRDRKGYKFQLTLHKDVPGNNTSCSDLDLSTFEIQAPTLPPVVTPPVVVPPITLPVGFTTTETEVLADFAQYLLAKKG